MISFFVAIASGRDARWPFPVRLADLMVALVQKLPEGSRLNRQVMRGFDTATCRRKLVAGARQWGASHILFLDDDMDFPADAGLRLLAHDKEIVAANYTTRCFPVVPLAQRNGERIPSRGRAGLEMVHFAPTGVMLIQMGVFDRIDRPYFETVCDPDSPDEESISDDGYFCMKAQKAGIPTWIDHDLSQQIGHVGDLAFVHASTEEPETDSLAERVRRVLR